MKRELLTGSGRGPKHCLISTISGPGNSSSGLGKNISGEEKGHFDRFPLI